MKHLEANRFEVAGIYGKRLIVITDSDRYGGNVNVLKALTGCDTIRAERKFIQNNNPGFVYQGMVMVAGNEIIQSADYTSGLSRRRVTVPFNNRVAPENRRYLIGFDGSKTVGEFAPHLPGLLNWVLAMPDAEVDFYIQRHATACPSLAAFKAEAMLETNPIAEWVDACLVVEGRSQTYVGIAQKEKDKDIPNQFRKIDEWLYANYSEFAVATGSHPIATKRFSLLLDDLMFAQLDYPVALKRDIKGSYFDGLAIRHQQIHANFPRPISGKSHPPNDCPPSNGGGGQPKPQGPSNSPDDGGGNALQYAEQALCSSDARMAKMPANMTAENSALIIEVIDGKNDKIQFSCEWKLKETEERQEDALKMSSSSPSFSIASHPNEREVNSAFYLKTFPGEGDSDKSLQSSLQSSLSSVASEGEVGIPAPALVSEPAPAPTEEMPICRDIETEISDWVELLECADSREFVSALAAHYKEVFGKDYERRKKEMCDRLSEECKDAIRLMKPASIPPDIEAQR